MGEEIWRSQFDESDYEAFVEKLRIEYRELERWFQAGIFASPATSAGFELEACLIDKDGRPADANDALIEALNTPNVVTELARFNIEYNGDPVRMAADGLSRFEGQLRGWYDRAQAEADRLGLQVVMIGMLPSLQESDLALSHISESNRYRAINRGIERLRGTPTVAIDIEGTDRYSGTFDSIMAEAAATSFQLHLTLPASQSARWYNAALIASGPVLAVSTNSPFLFGRDLWAETRVPVFAQSVDTGVQHYVSFGHGFLESSLLELFRENLERFPPVLPVVQSRTSGFPHSILHNGTIWRWNRPILGEQDGMHLRLEHRGLPSGPSITDMVANCAFFYGLVAALATTGVSPRNRMPFAVARRNFYAAARGGMAAELSWDGYQASAADLVTGTLLKLARHGLLELGIAEAEAARWLGVVRTRVRRGLSGAGWQRAWVARHGADMRALTLAYAERQRSGRPVEQWEI